MYQNLQEYNECMLWECIGVHWHAQECIGMHIEMYRNVYKFIGIYWNLQECMGMECLGIYENAQEYIGMYWKVQACLNLWKLIGMYKKYRNVLECMAI